MAGSFACVHALCLTAVGRSLSPFVGKLYNVCVRGGYACVCVCEFVNACACFIIIYNCNYYFHNKTYNTLKSIG